MLNQDTQNCFKHLFQTSSVNLLETLREGVSPVVSVYQKDTAEFAVADYINRKIPTYAINNIISEGGGVEIHGLCINNYESYLATKGLKVLNQIHLPHAPNPHSKGFNFIRPIFCVCEDAGNKKRLIAIITPGKDYINHFVNMIKYYIKEQWGQSSKYLKVFRYPSIEESLTRWTELDSNLVKQGDSVIMGFAEELNEKLCLYPGIKFISKTQNKYYTSFRYKLSNGRTLTFLGVKFNFYGDICRKITEKLCSLGIREIIYVSKIINIHKGKCGEAKVYSPTTFLKMRSSFIKNRVLDTSNGFTTMFPKFNTGVHLTVPNVLDEKNEQLQVAKHFHATSIDTETTQFAIAISEHNKKRGTTIKFSPVHFSGGYLHQYKNCTLQLAYDFENKKEAQKTKEASLQKISDNLAIYFNIKNI